MSVKIPEKSTGMLMDGIGLSSCVDSSNERIVIENADISDWEDGKGLCNWEHRGPDSSGSSPLDIVGKIIYCKKILKESDCENDRQRMYFDKIKGEKYVYVVMRLYDGAGHPGAIALAAQIRDHVANNEPIACRLSVEGTVLERDPSDKGVLTKVICKSVAITVKPCNRTCDTGVLADPLAPKGFELKEEKDAGDILASIANAQKTEGLFGFHRLGGSVEVECNPVIPLMDGRLMVKSLVKLKAFQKLRKAITAGSTAAAPGTLTGGAALQREDESLKRHHWINQAKSAYRDYDHNKPFKKEEFRAFVKHKMPDASDEFIDHFADMVDDIKLKGFKKAETAGPVEPGRSSAKRSGTSATEQVQATIGPKMTVRGQEVEPNPSVKIPEFDEQQGVLRTAKGTFPLYIPSRDTADNRNNFHAILNDPKVNAAHDHAMDNWAKVNQLFKEGRLPPEITAHAAMFSMLSPNTPVNAQELMYGHLVDTIHHTGIQPQDPEFGTVKEDWMARDKPDVGPQHTGSYFQEGAAFKLKHPSKVSSRQPGHFGSFMLPHDKFKNMARYHELHDRLVDMVARHRGDARGAAEELMAGKVFAQTAGGDPDLAVHGLAPKTARYALGMMGGGNVLVPDTHLVRHLFGLEHGKDTPTIDHLKNTLWDARNTEALNGIDRYYAAHHDAVQHMREHPKWKHLFDNNEEAIFPSFWKHWISIAPHERTRGMKTLPANEGTNHTPYWEAISPFVNKSEAEDRNLVEQTAAQHAEWVKEYGEMPALFMYYQHLVPKLLEAAANRKKDKTVAKSLPEFVRKLESLTINIHQALLKAAEQPAPKQFTFQGKNIQPGTAVVGPSRKPHHILHEEEDRYIAIPAHIGPDYAPEDMVSLPKSKENKKFRVLSRPTGPSPHVLTASNAVPELTTAPEQHVLLEGSDMKSWKAEEPEHAHFGRGAWVKAGGDRLAYLKAGHPDIKFGTPHRETAFYNLARNFFGLGECVPVTVAFRHPKTGVIASLQEAVPGAEHLAFRFDPEKKMQIPIDEHGKILHNLHQEGTLDKLGLMDFISGNQDRHDGNFVFDSNGQIKLIDNAMTHEAAEVPEYLYHHSNYIGKRLGQLKFHPEALSWLSKLDPAEMSRQMIANKVPQDKVTEAVKRLKLLQAGVAKFGPALGKDFLEKLADHLQPPKSRSEAKWASFPIGEREGKMSEGMV